ncbi:MAG: hypothetical protein Q9M26_03165, partial [Mariprofundales bacterium]|nr:hypothetical protein [Mariprofundales bacterium]
FFGGVVKTGTAMCLTHASISQWPETLDQVRIDRVIGALLHLPLIQGATIIRSRDQSGVK